MKDQITQNSPNFTEASLAFQALYNLGRYLGKRYLGGQVYSIDLSPGQGGRNVVKKLTVQDTGNVTQMTLSVLDELYACEMDHFELTLTSTSHPAEELLEALGYAALNDAPMVD